MAAAWRRRLDMAAQLALVAYVAWSMATLQAMRLRLTVYWMAPFFSGGGYSSEAIAYVLPLSQYTEVKIEQHGFRRAHAWPVRLPGDAVDTSFVHGLPAHERDRLQALAAKRVAPGASIVICHSEPGAWAPALYITSLCPPSPASAFVIGRTMFETDRTGPAGARAARLTPGHVDRCNKMDEVWVPSHFHVETFQRSGVLASKLVVVPESVDTDLFDPRRTAPLALPPAPAAGLADESDTYRLGASTDAASAPANLFRFLSVFKWEERKGWRILLQAYFREFSAADPVVLYLKTNVYHSRPDFKSQILRLIADVGLAPPAGLARLVILDRPIPGADMPGLYRAADAFVLPSRGEGWGRPHVEAMAMGLPVIATNWSGSTEFLRDSNSYPLPLDGMVTIESGPFRGHQWANPSGAHLQRLMRHLVEHRDEARLKGAQARADMVRLYHPDVVAKHVLHELHRIQAKVNASAERGWTPKRAAGSPAP